MLLSAYDTAEPCPRLKTVLDLSSSYISAISEPPPIQGKGRRSTEITAHSVHSKRRTKRCFSAIKRSCASFEKSC
ncbi:hypothetical protein Mapa_016575 [Marchantia paleacea]|nr:hypothetical protein Mapa_016575 [Marchantia paleacea]